MTRKTVLAALGSRDGSTERIRGKGARQMPADSPLLSLFKEQLDNECKAIGERNDLVHRGHQLNWWYFYHLHNFSDAEIGEVFCDGGGDLGIDSIWIDDDELVHFYQFKNPTDAAKGIPTGDLDKVLGGLRLILAKKHETVANPELRARIEEIYQMVPKGYRLHLVSSGRGIEAEAKKKLEAFVQELNAPTPTFFQWEEEPLAKLQERFYQQRLPAISEPLCFEPPQTPYMVRSAEADCYFFHTLGGILADLYATHGESLLQRNIRVDQRDTATNRSIEASCVGTDSANFLHYNNGVTFLCESAAWDQFKRCLTLNKSQVVNGGQTIRALYRARQKGSLKSDVLVPMRAITSRGDKDFASNVTVFQNSQNQMGTGFLRSNDPRVIQLEHSLASKDWYLERRDGEVANATDAEKSAIERRIGGKLADKVIKLKEGTQAYVATFFGQPELAKKDTKKMFLAVSDGGYFDKIFSTDLTAEKVIIAHQIKTHVDSFIKGFVVRKGRKDRVDDWKRDYKEHLGNRIVDGFPEIIDQMVPQSSVFLCATIYQEWVHTLNKDPKDLPGHLAAHGSEIIRTHIERILQYAKDNPKSALKSWPTLLKSNTFFNEIRAYLQGVHTGKNGH